MQLTNLYKFLFTQRGNHDRNHDNQKADGFHSTRELNIDLDCIKRTFTIIDINFVISLP